MDVLLYSCFIGIRATIINLINKDDLYHLKSLRMNLRFLTWLIKRLDLVGYIFAIQHTINPTWCDYVHHNQISNPPLKFLMKVELRFSIQLVHKLGLLKLVWHVLSVGNKVYSNIFIWKRAISIRLF